MNGIAKIKVKAWHFIVAICLFSVLLNTMEKRSSRQNRDSRFDDYLVELNKGDLSDSSITENCYILFHLDSSEYSRRMKYNFNRFVKEKEHEVDFYTVNLDKYPELYCEFNLSGVPSILIFKNGKEVKRILGVVSKYNLEKIYDIMNVLSSEDRSQACLNYAESRKTPNVY